MLSYALARLCWMPITLLGIALITFVLIDALPSDQAEFELQGGTNSAARSEQLQALRVHYGLVDPATGDLRPTLERFGAWLGRAAQLDLGPIHEDPTRFRGRVGQALAVSGLLGVLALAFVLGVGIPLGAWLGARAGSGADRFAAVPLFGLAAMPEFLVATLLVLFVGGGFGPALLPVNGLRSPGSEHWSGVAQVLDLGEHLLMPAMTTAIVPTITIVRFVRESLARTLRSDFVHAMRGFGVEESAVRRRALGNSLAPVWTLVGVIMPSLVTGALVAEQVFSIPGFGRLTFQAVMQRDVATTMAATLVSAVLVLLGLLTSDLLHRAADPRVELRR